MKKYSRTLPEKIELSFNIAALGPVTLTPLNFESKNWLLPDKDFKPDSVYTYWIADTALVRKDTLKLKITYNILDSAENLKPRNDTINLVYKKPKIKGRSKTEPVILVKVDCSCTEKSNVDLTDKVYLTTSHPLLSIDMSNMYLFKTEETKKIPVKFKLTRDSSLIRRYYINFPLEADYEYNLTTDSATFISIYQRANDSTTFKFRTQKDDYYGTIKLTLENVHQQMILQLINDRDNIMSEKIINNDQLVVFDFLAPGKYKIKAIYDSNKNKVWDTGNFRKRLQPEKVLYFSKELSIRSNWDDEETWKLE
jgi:hypothetical protein